ncbi:hypothetical protein KAX35_05040, partial [candidate division WOR-3 bacterium]|nr:hypothetical protein [candidate division WOR-3 bacterium]
FLIFSFNDAGRDFISSIEEYFMVGFLITSSHNIMIGMIRSTNNQRVFAKCKNMITISHEGTKTLSI